MTSLPFQKSAEFISAQLGSVHHDIAVVLGSGLGGFAKRLSNKRVLKTNDIPDYPSSTVPGHSGRIISGSVEGKKVLVFSGRVHYYESESTANAAATAIVSHQLGIKTIVLTNAAGILNIQFVPGDLMLISDQINLTSRNVLLDLIMPVRDLNPIYSKKLRQTAFEVAESARIGLRSGVYLGLAGPSYETPSEVSFYRDLNADAVGMSTIQEALFARSVGMEVVGMSCLTNYSTGITSERVSHEDVTKIGKKIEVRFSQLLKGFMKAL
jgi:purine-nucleoside phosphorylase